MILHLLPWKRIFITSLLMAVTLFSLRVIFGRIPFGTPYLIALFFPFLLIRVQDFKDAIFYGVVVGLLASAIASILFIWLFTILTINWIICSIGGVLLSYFVFERI